LVPAGDPQPAVLVGQLGPIDPRFALAADVDEDVLRRDVEDAAFHDLAHLQGRPGLVAREQRGEIFGGLWFVSHDGTAQSTSESGYYPLRRTNMYDLLLQGGQVVDPSTGIEGIHDVAVQGGTIARIAPNIPATEASRTINVRGKIVAPGLLDLHAHVFEGVNRTGVNPDLGGVYSGVTTIVDAGSAGAATFGGWRHILPHCHTEIIPFLHICQTGLATLPDIIAESSINLADT